MGESHLSQISTAANKLTPALFATNLIYTTQGLFNLAASASIGNIVPTLVLVFWHFANHSNQPLYLHVLFLCLLHPWQGVCTQTNQREEPGESVQGTSAGVFELLSCSSVLWKTKRSSGKLNYFMELSWVNEVYSNREQKTEADGAITGATVGILVYVAAHNTQHVC